jgi:hypothetical protein
MSQFDAEFRDAAEEIIAEFVATPTTMQRVRDAYTDTTGANSMSLVASASVLASPAIDYSVKEIDGMNILQGDMRMFVDAKSLEALVFDPVPTSEIQVLVDQQGKKRRVVSVRPYPGGDQLALYELQLRV